MRRFKIKGFIMYVGRDFDVSDVGENEVYSFNFVNDLPAGDSILSVVFNLGVEQGTDPSPMSRLNGGPGFVGTTVMQRVSGLLGGVTYTIQAVVTTALGNTISLWSRIVSKGPF